MKAAVYNVFANTGCLWLGLGAVLMLPAFANDAYFWLPAALAAQVWVCIVRRAGR